MGEPLDLRHFQEMKTEAGWRVRDVNLVNGHHLIYKIPLGEKSKGGITLPPQYRKKATRNVIMILGYVVGVSNPWRRKHNRKYLVWDKIGETWKTEWKVWDGKAVLPADFEAGSCVLYNTYNVGKVKSPELSDPLVVVRDIDIAAHFSVGDLERVKLGERSLDRFQDKWSVHVGI